MFFDKHAELDTCYERCHPACEHGTSVPSHRRISGLAKFCAAAENPRKKMRPPKTSPNFRKSVSRRENLAKFG